MKRPHTPCQSPHCGQEAIRRHQAAGQITVGDRFWSRTASRCEIEQADAAGHAGLFKNSALTAWPEDARRLGPDVIIAHVLSEFQGDDRVPGQARRALMTPVIERRGLQWKIIAAHDTNVAAPSA